ncbi:hypothetical protein JI735_15310 [Paenibacillus sonchi]|uniref:Uncharacterized protein n=1 Tax=Paenibacillus sonchi TaxID=373687 RepID=A0A974PH53_9BACL|nr:hypothetical protein [Paenibacillus sonchi]QQZ63680.1 hypothetical protein JI735_15310 [Paenibacillus sonchi]
MSNYTSIRPGQMWFDTGGKRIQAHGGSIFYEEDIQSSLHPTSNMDRAFNPERAEEPFLGFPDYNSKENTNKADYVWLPFRFVGTMAIMDRKEEWRVEDYE